MRSKKIYFILLGIAAFSFILVNTAARTKSLTYDEPTFIVSGYSYLDTDEIILNPEAPPLLQKIMALPLMFLDLQSPDYLHENYNANGQIIFANIFFEENGDKLGEITFLSRLPIQLFFALLVLMAGIFVKKLAGSVPAIIASILVTFSPNLIAHGQLATTDLGCTVFMFISVYAFYMAVRSEHYKYWIICGLVTGIAISSKYTALLLAPIFLIIILYEILFNKRCKIVLLRGSILLILFMVLILCVSYDFKPWLYIHGLSQIYVRTQEYYFYLFGNVLAGSVWYYYFAALLVKTPIATLLLLMVSVYVAIRYYPDRDAMVYLLVPVVLIMFVCSFDEHNIGLRRILPIYPFLFSFISCTYFYPNRNKVKILLFNGLLVCSVFSAVVTYPNYLSFFNVVAGGASNGPNLLEDSNLDWGQDLPALVEWQKNNLPAEFPINLMYFGAINPRLYGLSFRQMSEDELVNPRNGIYAISAHYLIYTRKLAHWNKANLDWLKLYEPVGYAGNSIYIYQFTDKLN